MEEGKLLNNEVSFNIVEFCEKLSEELKLTLKKGQKIIYKYKGDQIIISLDNMESGLTSSIELPILFLMLVNILLRENEFG